MRKCKAVFLDRDGTLNREVNYLHRVEDLRLLPGAAEAVGMLNQAGYKVIIITNQSGIARGYFNVEDMVKVNDEISRRLKRKGAHIDRVYFCPHYPEGKIETYSFQCGCRKPADGMFSRAALENDIDMKKSFAIGDRIRDLQPAMNLGCKGILVMTGHGEKEMKNCRNWPITPDYTAKDLKSAVESFCY